MAKWHIQDTHRSFDKINNTADALIALNYDFEGFGVIPGQPTNIDFSSESNVISGSVKVLIDSFDNPELFKHMFYDVKKFDQLNYRNEITTVNEAGEISKYNDIMHSEYSQDMFVKPSSDVKVFAGSILPAGTSLFEYLSDKQRIISKNTLVNNPNILVAPLRTDIFAEYRLSVVNGEIVHKSRYFKNGILSVSANVDPTIINEAYKIISKYEPHDVFVLDVCETSKGVEVMEINCWNCSGIYNWDVSYMYKKVNEYADIRNAGSV